MSYRAKAFPHPVASPYANDYPGEVLSAQIDLEVAKERGWQALDLRYDLELNNQALVDTVIDQLAELFIDVESVGTRRRLFPAVGVGEGTIQLGDGLLNGTVRCTPILVARVDIEQFEPSPINKEFYQHRFFVPKGSYLAIGTTTSIDVDFDQSRPSNWVRFARVNDLHPNQYLISTDQPQIVVNAGENIMAFVNAAENSKRADLLFISIFRDCFRVGIASLSEMDEPEQPWQKALSRYLEDRGMHYQGVGLDDLELLAQDLVGEFGVERLLKNGL